MFPESIRLTRFRCFEAQQLLPLRRLTLLYGENNTGKSALARLLPLLADSCAPRASGTLATRSKALRGAPLRSLFWREGHELELAPSWGGFAANYNIRVDADIDEQRAVVDRCTLSVAGVEHATARLSTDSTETHRWTFADGRTAGGGFRGLVPTASASAPTEVHELRRRMQSLHGTVAWLQARRAPLARSRSAIDDPFWTLEPDGADVIELLSSQRPIAARVSDWFARHLGLLFDVSRPTRSTDASLVLQTPDGYRSNIADGSEGLQFIIPPLAALGLLYQHSPEGPRALVLEEPEGHLHGRLQRALAAEIIDVVERTPDAHVVLETHSPIFLTAVQLAIVTASSRRAEFPSGEGRPLSPDDVAVCLVEREGNASVIRELPLDADGAPRSSALMDFFSEEHAIAQELLDARRNR